MDYGTRIADINKQIGQAQSNYNTVNQQASGAYNKFNDALGNVKSYGDIYSQARDKAYSELGVNDARDAYINARNAVDQVNTTINKLPESIRQQYGGTGLTEAQRQRAMQSQFSDMTNTYNMLNTNYLNTSADYQSLLKQAMAQISEVAGMTNDNQWRNVGALQNAWATLLGQSNEAYNRILNNRSQLNDVYGQKMTDENAAATLAFQRWAKEQDLARARESENAQLNLQRYLANQATAQAQAQAKLQQQLIDRQNRAAYNAYRSAEESRINNQFKKDNSNLWNYFWSPVVKAFGGEDYGTSILNKASNARNSILSYDQFIGAR